MRYHFVVNGYADDICRQMEEQMGFAEKYLSGMEQGETIIYCQKEENVQALKVHLAKEALLILPSEQLECQEPSPECQEPLPKRQLEHPPEPLPKRQLEHPPEPLPKRQLEHPPEAGGGGGCGYVPEMVLDALCSRADQEELYIFGNDDSGIELAVRMAVRLSGSSVTEALKLSCQADAGEKTDQPVKCHIYVSKMVYANHMEATFVMEQGPYCISLARGGERCKLKDGTFTIKEKMICENKAEYIVSQEFCPEESKAGFDNAKVILAAGRGVKNRENMKVIDEAAGYLEAEVAVSRPAAMNAWKPMNRLIGVSGAMVSPEICIAAGVSGAAAFYAGIEKSKFIVAINTDEKAPIMKKADVAVVEDFLPIMEELKNICR